MYTRYCSREHYVADMEELDGYTGTEFVQNL